MSNSISKIKKKLASARAIEEELNVLNVLLTDKYIEPEETIAIEDEISKLTAQLAPYNSKRIENITSKFIEELEEIRVVQDDLKNLSCEFLFPSFLVKNEITLIAAKPASGKSLTMSAAASMALETKAVEYVFYFDLDNSTTTLKTRGIDSLVTKWGTKFIYLSPVKKSNGQVITKASILKLLRKLQTKNLENVLLVFDSAKNFLKAGADRDKNKDVSHLMEYFKSFRDRGASVVLLHHTNKPQQDIEELTYAGSSAWAEDSSNAFILKHNEYKNVFIFTPIKNRIGELKQLAFEYQKHTLVEIDILLAQETEEINSEIVAFISDKDKTPPSYSQIMSHLLKLGYARNKINLSIQNGKNRYWEEKKLVQNNRSVFSIIRQSCVQELKTTDQHDFSISEDKSDKSYFMTYAVMENTQLKSDKKADVGALK